MNDPPPPAKFEFYNKEIYKQLFYYFFRTLKIKKVQTKILPSPLYPYLLCHMSWGKNHIIWLYVLPIVVGEDIYILPSTYDFLIQ